jgi:hypothetical protein
MNAVHASQISIHFYQTTWHHIPGDSIFQVKIPCPFVPCLLLLTGIKIYDNFTAEYLYK